MADKYYLYCVDISDSVALSYALKIAKSICHKMPKSWLHLSHRVEGEPGIYRFKNIPKNRFRHDTFRSQTVRPGVKIAFGMLLEPTPAIEGSTTVGED